MVPDFAYERTPSAEEQKQVYRDRLIPGDLYLLEHDGEILWVMYKTMMDLTNSPDSIEPAERQIVEALLDEGFLVSRITKNGARAWELVSKSK
jgi:hypothetical protein